MGAGKFLALCAVGAFLMTARTGWGADEKGGQSGQSTGAENAVAKSPAASAAAPSRLSSTAFGGSGGTDEHPTQVHNIAKSIDTSRIMPPHRPLPAPCCVNSAWGCAM